MPRSNASFLGQLLGTSQKITASALDDSVVASLSGGGVDSAAIIGIIDSDYVQTRAPSVDLSAINQSIIPNTNATYDIGSASYKIRDLYLSDNSMHIGENILSVNASKLLFNGEDVMDYASLTGAPTLIVTSDISGITGAGVISNIVSLTQADYDAISTPDSITLYVITG
jgi:hypothetical protein